MSSLPQEFMVLCRQWGEAQQRCSAAMAAQAAEMDALRSEVVRLRGALVVRGTELAMVREALEQAHAANPGLPRRMAMARHIRALAERIATLSRERLRWRLDAQQVPPRPLAEPQLPERSPAQSPSPAALNSDTLIAPATLYSQAHGTGDLDAALAAADLVICQTGCISHDDYWRVQDHCHRTGKPCILADQPLAATRPLAALQMFSSPRSGPAAEAAESNVNLNEIRL